MDIRLIALDMDGTLLGADHATIPPRNVSALREASARGVKIAIASGRSWSLIEETARSLGAVDYAVTANGAYVLETAGERMVCQQGIGKAQCGEIIRVLAAWDLPYEMYVDGDNYVLRRDVERMGTYVLSADFADMFRRHMIVVEDMNEALERGMGEKFNLFYVPQGKKEALLRDLNGTGPLFFAGALGSNLEFNAPGVSKGAALETLCAQLGIAPGEVMAFGDADNDLEMLSWAGWSFAMENGCQAVKDAARFIAPSNARAGVGQMVEQCVLRQVRPQ